jgi:hypothetical protein
MKKEKPFRILEINPGKSSLVMLFLFVLLVIWLTGNYLLGIIIAIPGLALTIMPTGFIIDRKNNKIKKVYYFLGLPIGKWKELPRIQYISLLRVIHKGKRRQIPAPAFASGASGHYMYQVNLIIEEDRLKPFRLISTSREQAINEGLKLGEYLNLKVFDMTTQRKKWIR